MRNSHECTALALLVCAVMIAACSIDPSSEVSLPDPEDPETMEVRRQIAEAWRLHIDAAQRKDLAGVMEIYAEDILYSVPGGPGRRGAYGALRDGGGSTGAGRRRDGKA